MIRQGTYQVVEIERRESLPRGPWTEEPNKATWVDDETDLDCMIVRNRAGALCGYVGVPPEHPLHGVDYGQYNKVSVLVHGDLTYSDSCQEEGTICHVPLEGRSHDIWWFGFDCGHADDLVPAFVELDSPLLNSGIYRNWEYVVNEVTDLARQLKELADEYF